MYQNHSLLQNGVNLTLFLITTVGTKVVKAAGGTLDVAATAAACTNATSNTLVFTSI